MSGGETSTTSYRGPKHLLDYVRDHPYLSFKYLFTQTLKAAYENDNAMPELSVAEGIRRSIRREMNELDDNIAEHIDNYQCAGAEIERHYEKIGRLEVKRGRERERIHRDERAKRQLRAEVEGTAGAAESKRQEREANEREAMLAVARERLQGTPANSENAAVRTQAQKHGWPTAQLVNAMQEVRTETGEPDQAGTSTAAE